MLILQSDKSGAGLTNAIIAGFNATCVLQGNYKNGFVYWIILMITFWILYSYLVPISLFVTLEIVKFWQGFLYINHDKEMKVGCHLSLMHHSTLDQPYVCESLCCGFVCVERVCVILFLHYNQLQSQP